MPGVAVGVSVEFGSPCVFGYLGEGSLVLDAGGVTGEGSCLPGFGGH